MDRISELREERERLKKRLDWLGVRSTGSDRIEAQIRQIDAEIAYIESKASSKRSDAS